MFPRGDHAAILPRMKDLQEAIARLSQSKVRVAVVGASATPSKFGNRIVRSLLSFGCEVVPVHPTAKTIEGLEVMPSVGAIEAPLDIVNVVVPPPVALETVGMLPQHADLVWFQPGAYDDAVLAAARQRCAHVVFEDCIMVEVARCRAQA